MQAGQEPTRRGDAGDKLWAAGEAYEPYVGRWSRIVAPEFIRWLGVAPGARWLDIGCGTGALTGTILDLCDPASVVGVEPSEAFLAYARSRVMDPRAEFRQGNAQALPVSDAEFDAVVSGLVLNFVPDQRRAAAEMRRVTGPGGRIAAYVWDYAAGMQMMRHFWDAAAALDPQGAGGKDEALRFALCQPEPLRQLFEAAGLSGVQVTAIEIPTVFCDFEDYWTPFLAGGAPAPAYCMSLAEDRRTALRERLRASLPTEPDGRIPLKARAWAVQGRA